MKTSLLSIIIPVFNRAALVQDTLDSILAQTFKNWECIVVDDGSTDDTWKVLEKYTKKDSRIKCFQRPDFRQKGANACRNIGFEKSIGSYVIWFDSDDLMTPDHLESKLRFVEAKKLDFVVARTQNFKNDLMLEPYVYDRKEYGIRASEFILLNIHWYTYDVILKREIAEKISWNENMKSWQDYNYFCKMLLKTEHGDYLDEILTHRRIHSSSIQKSLHQNSAFFNKELLENRILTYNDISEEIDDYTRKELVFGMMNICFELSKMGVRTQYKEEVGRIVKNQFGEKPKVYFEMALLSANLIKKGYYFLNRAKKNRERT